MKRLTAIAIPAFLAVLMMKPVAAADFTITVPIHIQNLEEHIQNLTAHCRVYGANSRGGDDSLARDAHALAVDPNTGNVDADVVFNLTVDPQYGENEAESQKTHRKRGKRSRVLANLGKRRIRVSLGI